MEFNINVPVHARAFGDSVEHLSSFRLRKKTTTGYTASGANCMNNGTRVNLRGDAGSVQKLNTASSCDLLFGSIAAGGVKNDYKQAANFPAQSPFDDLVHHIEYSTPHSNPHSKNSSRMSTSFRPSIDPLQRPSRRPCTLTSDSTLPQNLSSISNNPPSLTLPRDTSSRPTFTSSTNSNNRKTNQTPASPRPILSSQCPELNLCHNLNLSSTPPQASSSHNNFSSHTISPGQT
ncbi:hypothetical protein DID88_007165 [Monilinia fructigena]|uniref:Uncharacterized protein n=1 Tax=Monilinia fructigena TaxID=38457 RepID=A0A395J866_9HELO|nr:hypothetical protein DID88_007165 [Monilinia fructigena]